MIEAFSKLSNVVIGAAIEVHRHLGPGLLESAYRKCLVHELEIRGIPCRTEVPLQIQYKALHVEAAYRVDVLVSGALIAELKCAEKTLPIHEAQLLTYMKLTGIREGMLINVNTVLVKDGIRVVTR